MARKRDGFNLSATIREYQKGHRGITAREAFDAIKKTHPSEKINEATFKSTFYKLAGGGKKRTVRRRKPGRGDLSSGGHSDSVLKAGLSFIRLAGSLENAKEQLAGLEELIRTARSVH